MQSDEISPGLYVHNTPKPTTPCPNIDSKLWAGTEIWAVPVVGIG